MQIVPSICAVRYLPAPPVARFILAALVLSGGGLGFQPGALAQSIGPQIEEPEDVPGNRVIAEYAPIGYDLSGFNVFPAITLGARADSNVFAQENKHSDLALQIEPRIRAQRENSVTNLMVDASLKRSFYLSLTDQDSTEYGVRGTLTYGTRGPNSITLDTGYRREVIQRGTVESDLVSGAPAMRRTLFGSITGRKQFNRLSLDGQVIGTALRYENIEDGSGGVIDQHFRNVERWGLQGVAAYEISARTSAYAAATFDHFDYRRSPALDDRDADNTSATVGLRYEITRLLYAELALGLRHYDFRDKALPDFSGLAISGHLRYFPSRLLAIRGKIEQTNTTSPYDMVGAVTLSNAQVEAEYEMRRSLSWLGKAAYTFEDYAKQDYSGRRLDLSGGPRLRLNRWLRGDASLGYARRNARGPAPFASFTQVYGLVSVTFSR